MVDDFHPDLHRIARFTPSRGMRMTPRKLPVARTMVGLFGVGGPRDVEVVSLGPGAGVRCTDRRGSRVPHRVCCGFTVAATS